MEKITKLDYDKHMKIIFLILFFSLSIQAQSKRVKKNSPYQSAIENCFVGSVPASQINDNRRLYHEISKVFILLASETTFREVSYVESGVSKKLRFEDGIVQLFEVDKDQNVNLVKTDNLAQDIKNNSMRYKVNSPEARINQILNRAEIKSDFVKTSEYRSKQLSLELVWSDDQIRKLNAKIEGEKPRTLECIRRETSDICECKK